MKILDVDAGNTRIKWRLVCGKRVDCFGAVDNGDEHSLDVLLNDLPETIDRCRVASVRSAEVTNQLCTKLQQRLGVKPELPLPESGVGDVVYENVDPRRLGDDRWLAMLGARRLYPDKTTIVVDSGTALTLDVVNSQGSFDGGMICPGVGTMLKSLTDSADLLVLPDKKIYSRKRAFGSVQSVLNGVVSMAASLIEREVQKIDEEVIVVLCGGDAQVLAEQLMIPAVCCPDLVFDGLTIALP